MIRLEAIHRDFQVGDQVVHALDDINLQISQGEYISVMGPSGSGKSTLLNLIGLLDHPTAGKYFLNDRNVTELDEEEESLTRNQQIGFVFQAFHLVGHLTALQNVMVPLLLAGQSFKAARLTAQDWLSRLGLEERINGRPDELSGGQQQRVCIARALAHSPKLVLADEPTGNLDPTTAQSSLNLLCQQCRQTGAALVMVTHSHQAAQQLDAHYELAQGRLHPMPKPGLPAGSL